MKVWRPLLYQLSYTPKYLIVMTGVALMCGALDRYEDEDYFLSHQDGILMTPEGNYDLKVFACMRTDAYDAMIYYVNTSGRDVIPAVLEYVSEHATNFVQTYSEDMEKIIALSTCADRTTNGRMVVFADAVPRYTSVEKSSADEAIPAFSDRIIEGHPMGAGHWALLNFVCIAAMLLTLLPLSFIRKKYHQLPYTKRLINKLHDETNGAEGTAAEAERVTLIDDLKCFRRKMTAGLIAEILALLAAVIAFILTEDIRGPMVIRDEWTWLMVLIFAVALALDFILFRYRGRRPPKEYEDATEDKA